MRALNIALLLVLAFAPAGAAQGRAAKELEVTVKLPLGRSAVMDFPSDIVRISVGNPEVADAVAVSARELMINTQQKPGAATVVVWGKDGRRTVYHVEAQRATNDKQEPAMDHDVEKIQALFRQTFPNEDIRVHAAQGVVSLTGRVSSEQVAEAALELAKPLGGVVSNFEVTGRRSDSEHQFLSSKEKPVLKGPEEIQKLLDKTFPNETIRLRATQGLITLSGRVSSEQVAKAAVALVTPMAKSVVSNMEVAQPGPDKQVLLRVKFAELNRNAIDSFGVNLVSTGFLNTPGSTTTGQFSSARPVELQGTIPGQIRGTTSKFTISDALNVFAFRPDLNLAAFVRALESRGLLQILAEPNLVTTNGKEASFLVGGEFPIPVIQGGVNAGAITVQFREFGIRVNFLPLITPNRTIKMLVRPEVSTIDLSNAVVFSGFTIPALATRRMETHVELGPGQSFVIAGLIDDRVTENLSKIPGLAQIPILGALFKSRQANRAKTELVVIVSPEITTPLQPGEPLPVPEMPKEFLAPFEQKPAAGSKTGSPEATVRPAARPAAGKE